MQITIYFDLVFIINFLMDFYVLLATGLIIHQKIKMIRIILGALFGSVMILPCLFYPKLLLGVSGILITIGISMGTVMISLGTAGGFVRKWFLSTTIMVLFAGIFQFIKYRFGNEENYIYTWMIFFLLTGAAGSFLMPMLIRSRERGRHIYHVIIHSEGKTIEENFFEDSGNRLWDHMYTRPVILLSEDILADLISEDELNFVNKYKNKGYIDYKDPILLRTQKKACFHEIAYQSVGRSSGKLLCFLLDSVEVPEKNKIYMKQPAAVADKNLFCDKDYRGLLFSDDI